MIIGADGDAPSTTRAESPGRSPSQFATRTGRKLAESP